MTHRIIVYAEYLKILDRLEELELLIPKVTQLEACVKELKEGVAPTGTTRDYVYHTPNGVYETLVEAAKANDLTASQVSYRVKRNNYPTWTRAVKP